MEKYVVNVNTYTRSYVANLFNNNHICKCIADEKITKFLDENLYNGQEIMSDYGSGC